jgi:hypothetical protein
MILFPIACIKCVLPSPTVPYKNNGLYACPGLSATALEAENAMLLVAQTTKVSNVNFGSKRIPKNSDISFLMVLFSIVSSEFLVSLICKSFLRSTSNSLLPENFA